MNNSEGVKSSVYIVHGFAAAPVNHWFQSLKAALQQKNVEVHIPAMPESSTPDLQKWLAHLKNEVTAQKRAFFVGHSLGCIWSAGTGKLHSLPILLFPRECALSIT